MKSRKSISVKKSAAKKPTVRRKTRVRISGVKTSKPSRKKLLDELILIEREGQIYQRMLKDPHLKKEPEITKSAKAGLKQLARRQRAIFKALGI
jgi:hypothetical protein